ncbi:MAG: hypothetical protein HC923_12490 [Myxococcales bacterium]|nr:hypothetical protein [Myxococcales bacterium]
MQGRSAYIIDDDHELALMVGAPLQSSGMTVTFSEAAQDPLEELRRHRADVVLVRAEARGRESGYALVSRIKNNRRFRRMLVVLYTDRDENLPALEAHREQGTPADAYLVMPSKPPYRWDDLRREVSALLEKLGNEPLPPPLPGPTGEPREAARSLSDEDRRFLEQIQSEEPISSPSVEVLEDLSKRPGAGRRATADAKLELLRQQLRQKEVELAKYKDLFRAKEREYQEWNERLVEKDVEIHGLRMEVEELNRTLAQVGRELDTKTTEFNRSFESQQEDKIARENELIQVVASKEKELAEVRGELNQNQADAIGLRERTAAERSRLEDELRVRERRDCGSRVRVVRPRGHARGAQAAPRLDGVRAGSLRGSGLPIQP